ncbi:hypothetical protein F0562_024614 [Nyssa sinensis]|uniref:Uncharacterized protein n=1 Tax=Nyssa sinensis TaxID=561372 RepID=A0A5J5BFI7_9ASTE|nr:hypothetical protein F0562_024614 [Nyssa sinensis]
MTCQVSANACIKAHINNNNGGLEVINITCGVSSFSFEEQQSKKMEGRGHNFSYQAGEMTGQAQLKKDEMMNQSSNAQNPAQSTNFLQETGTHVKNMAHGAADIAHGAVGGAASIAQGAALGAANIAQGAADAVKNTFGMNNNPNPDPNTNTNHPSKPTTRI